MDNPSFGAAGGFVGSSNAQLELLPGLAVGNLKRQSPRTRYIGSKARVAEQIIDLIGRTAYRGQRFVDLFCGAGSVSRAAFCVGWRVHANDQLVGSALITYAQLLGRDKLSFQKLGGYEAAVTALNDASGSAGVIFKEYAPSGLSQSGHVRKYFSCANAAKIDGIRLSIEKWSNQGLIQSCEKAILIADLITAANAVANIAGTYGCFLSRWTPAALSPFHLRPRCLPEQSLSSTCSVVDAFDFTDCVDDIVYCDPPYTKRQYAAYYHLIETIAAGDFPAVEGVAGIRAWEHHASPFCYKRRALAAFERLARSLSAKHVFISYSSDAHIQLASLTKSLADYGHLTVHKLRSIARYAPNAVSRLNSKPVTEYLIELAR